MRPHGRAQVSSRNPRAFGICDRCGFLYNHNRLQWQMDWAGASLINKRVLVCDTCLDVPQQQLRAIVVPADPIPIQNPRIQDYATAETNYRSTSGQDTVNQKTGIPVPGTQQRITSDGYVTGGDLLLEDGVYFLVQEDGSYIQEEGTNIDAPGGNRVTQQTGAPDGSLNEEPGTDPNAPGDADPGLPYNYNEVPKTGPLS